MKLVSAFLLLIPGVLNAWNANGHILIARLSYQMLSPSTRAWLMTWQDTKNIGGRPSNLEIDAIWLDKFYSPSYRQLRKLHYIQLPLGDKRYFPEHIDSKNALSAIHYAYFMLGNNTATMTEKVLALRVLLHIIADIHQPLHTVNYYSRHFKNGDRGGNSYKFRRNKVARNLHAYWDKGGGLLENTINHQISQQLHWFDGMHCKPEDSVFLPEVWVKESYTLAKQYAYFPPQSMDKMRAYQQTTQTLSKQQIFKAACRLAGALNHLRAQRFSVLV